MTDSLHEKLLDIHNALDDALGDSDIDHIESDEELRDEEPVQWAAQKLMEVIDHLEKMAPQEVAKKAAQQQALRAFAVHATYPVSIEINPRGYAWHGEKVLDYAKGLADAVLSEAESENE